MIPCYWHYEAISHPVAHYPDAEPTNLSSVSLMLSARKSDDKYSKTSLNRPTPGSTDRSVYGVKISLWVTIWDPNKVIDIGRWSMCRGGQIEKFYCMYICRSLAWFGMGSNPLPSMLYIYIFFFLKHTRAIMMQIMPTSQLSCWPLHMQIVTTTKCINAMHMHNRRFPPPTQPAFGHQCQELVLWKIICWDE